MEKLRDTFNRIEIRVVPVAGRFKTDSASGIKPVGNQELEKKSDNRPSTGILKTGWKPVEVRFIEKITTENRLKTRL